MLDKRKVKRELVRIVKQIVNIPSAINDQFFSTMYYDLFLASKVSIVQGEVPLKDKAAVFLIFPTLGLTVGHLDSLRYINSAGYSPVVVSNCPLTDEDVGFLRPLAHKIVVRPNYGYDFGGYRDGIRLLKGEVDKISNLVIFNDSCWFPLPNSKCWLETAERMRVDFAGALPHTNSKWFISVSSPRDLGGTKESDNNSLHYGSFALMFSREALARKEFWIFWDRLRLSSSKNRTVKYGEKKLSKFMFTNGFSHASALTEHDIAYSVRHSSRTQHAEELRVFLANGGLPAYALPGHLWSRFGYMFLKKKADGRPLENRSSKLDDFAARASQLLRDKT